MANMGRRLIRSHKYRLHPNGAQEAALSDTLGHFRDLCNAGLQQRIEAWRRQGVSLGYVRQADELKADRGAASFLGRPRRLGGGGGMMDVFARTCSGTRSACCRRR